MYIKNPTTDDGERRTRGRLQDIQVVWRAANWLTKSECHFSEP